MHRPGPGRPAAGARPELREYPDSLEPYDTVYLGYPNYWGTMPMPVFTFLEHFDFSGKTIRPFCTHEGSGLGHSVEDIRRLCPGAGWSRGWPSAAPASRPRNPPSGVGAGGIAPEGGRASAVLYFF